MQGEIITAGFIGAGAAILSSAITGFITYKVSVKSEKLQRYQQKMVDTVISSRDLGHNLLACLPPRASVKILPCR
jgi:hypothetical protein